MKLIIAGTRSLPPKAAQLIPENIKFPERITEVVSGCARGADRYGEQWAESHGVPIKPFPAEWNRWGRLAGRIRNRQMAQYGDCLLAIWDGKSRGTANMIHEMRELGKPMRVVRVAN